MILLRQVHGRRLSCLHLYLTGKPWQTSSPGVSSYSGCLLHLIQWHLFYLLGILFQPNSNHNQCSSNANVVNINIPLRPSWPWSEVDMMWIKNWGGFLIETYSRGGFLIEKYFRGGFLIETYFRGGGFALAAGSDRSGLSKWIGKKTQFWYFQELFWTPFLAKEGKAQIIITVLIKCGKTLLLIPVITSLVGHNLSSLLSKLPFSRFICLNYHLQDSPTMNCFNNERT